MPDIYDFDVIQQAPEILPPDKRGMAYPVDDKTNITLLQSLLKGVQWCRDLILGSYRNGSTDYGWSPGAYNKFERVIYKKAVYYSLIDGNDTMPSETSTTWLKIQPNFLGVNQRVRFNGQNLVLEFALNQRFSGVFRPPPASTRSDIYMTNLGPVFSGFRVAETTGSTVGQTTSTDKIGLSYPFVRIYNFEVHVKASVFALTNEQEIRDFINLYLPSSLNFTVTTY